MHAFKRVMDSYKKRYNKRSSIPKNIDHDEYKIEDKMDEILRLLKNKKRMKFSEFFTSARTKLEIVVIFLAMLELIKLRHIRVFQEDNFSDILIEGMVD
jgi:segregation and condensation protein A